MKYYLVIIASLLFFNSCKKVAVIEVRNVSENIVAHQVLKLSEKSLGKALYNAISVLPKESQDYLLEVLAKNPKLMVFFKENPTFVCSWEYLRKYLKGDCLDPEFLRMFVYANKYASYQGNKLENFVYKKGKDAIQVLTKNGVELAKIKPGRVIEVIGDDVNNWFLQLKPFPNAKYVINGAEYMTDDAGRVVSSKVSLSKSNLGKARYRDSGVQKKMAELKGSLPGDDAGHLIANQFGGSTNMVNLVPMKSEINRSEFKILENKWKELLEESKKVRVEIKLKYPTHPAGTERPDWIEVLYEVDGKVYTERFKNI